MMLKLEIEKEKTMAYAEGYAEGLAESRIEGIKYLMKNKGLSAEAAMEAAGIPKKEFPRYMTML